jgi:hypothetical protein
MTITSIDFQSPGLTVSGTGNILALTFDFQHAVIGSRLLIAGRREWVRHRRFDALPTELPRFRALRQRCEPGRLVRWYLRGSLERLRVDAIRGAAAVTVRCSPGSDGHQPAAGRLTASGRARRGPAMKRDGRSAVMRRPTAAYLRRKRQSCAADGHSERM